MDIKYEEKAMQAYDEYVRIKESVEVIEGTIRMMERNIEELKERAIPLKKQLAKIIEEMNIYVYGTKNPSIDDVAKWIISNAEGP